MLKYKNMFQIFQVPKYFWVLEALIFGTLLPDHPVYQAIYHFVNCHTGFLQSVILLYLAILETLQLYAILGFFLHNGQSSLTEYMKQLYTGIYLNIHTIFLFLSNNCWDIGNLILKQDGKLILQFIVTSGWPKTLNKLYFLF